MRKIQKLFVMALVTALLGSTAGLQAEEGDGYEQCCYRTPRPEWALAGLAAVAVVAICLQKTAKDRPISVHTHTH